MAMPRTLVSIFSVKFFCNCATLFYFPTCQKSPSAVLVRILEHSPMIFLLDILKKLKVTSLFSLFQGPDTSLPKSVSFHYVNHETMRLIFFLNEIMHGQKTLKCRRNDSDFCHAKNPTSLHLVCCQMDRSVMSKNSWPWIKKLSANLFIM